MTCPDSVNNEGGYLGNRRNVSIQEAIQQGRIREWQSGATAWGDYVCGSCSNVRSMKPDLNDKRICESCGKPHTGEVYFEPAQIEYNGKVYLVNSRNFVTGAKEGLAAQKQNWSCPFCTTTNVVGKEDCPSCGAHFSGQSKYLADLAKAVERYHTQRLKKPALVATASTTYNHTLPAQVVKNDLAGLKRLYGIAATAVVGVALAGTVYYFHEAHASPGQISRVNGQEIHVEYQKKKNPETLVLTIPEGRIHPKVGESVSVHWTHRHGAIGVERENGGDFVQLEKRTE